MLFALLLTLSLPADWVPARWHWLETKTLELVSGTPVNCLLVDWDPRQKTQAAAFAGAAADVCDLYGSSKGQHAAAG